MAKFPHYTQQDYKDCGPTCLKIIAKYYNKVISLDKLRALSETTRIGSSLLGLSEAAEKIGFHSIGAKGTLNNLLEVNLPCILHWNKNHFVVLYRIRQTTSVLGRLGRKESPYTFYISDPAHGHLKYSQEELINHWIGNNANPETDEGIVLLLEPRPKLYNLNSEVMESSSSFSFLSRYVVRYKQYLWQLLIGLVAISLLQLVFPFLTQSIIDIGIKNQDLHFIYLVLFAQLAIFMGRTAIEVVRSWILLHLSTRINISLVSDFFIKLMNLPIGYFDTRLTGDILQRISDHKRIELILTTSSLNVLFSLINFVVFSLVLAYYDLKIFGVFMVGSILYFLWISVFLKRRRDLDYKNFSQLSQEQSKVIELINGMQDIKLHNAEKQKRWGWEFLQARLFNLSIKGLSLEQYQTVGSGFINELKNILITILSAKLVIDGEITLGMMLAIAYIVGQLNSPIAQLIDFVREVQDAKISLERLSEIHDMEDEEPLADEKISIIPNESGFQLKNISFRYKGSDQSILNGLSLHIPANKITAIVGVSGSGKTTLIKLLLKFYDPIEGQINLGNYNLKNLSQRVWRDECGVVLQEGFIFSDTIANNIAIGENYVDKKKLAHAIDIANIREFIEMLPLSYNTKIGREGMGLSTGQKQRLLIARAVYKNPNYLFFDEATSALDANNEKVIMDKLNTFFQNKTVLIVAHRLSTVRNAHQIVVLDQGKIVEVGSHDALARRKGHYYNLVKNQLELGK
ncbi:MAG: peptidase domain-containing ABC transporter [Bacteroidota bacterium]